MLNPINSPETVRSVQRDYYQAAENHRLAKASDNQPTSPSLVKIGLTLTAFAAIVVLIAQFITV